MTLQRSRIAASGFIAVLLGAVLLPSSGTAATEHRVEWRSGTPSSDSAESTAHGVDPYVLEDMESIAADEGIPLEVAISRYAWHGEFADIAGQVEAAFPHDFAGAAVNTSGDQSATISFAGTVPDGVERILADSPVDVTIEEGTGLTLVDRAELVSTVHYSVFDTVSAESVSTYFDDETKTMHVSVESPATEGDAVTARSRASGALVASGQTAFKVVIETVEGEAAGEDTIRGGAYLTTGTALNAACTSGWPVKKNGSSQKGLITADHCSNSLRYSGRNVLTYRSRLPSNRGDIDYRSSSEAVGKEFYYATGSYRTITGLGTPADNQQLCKFGRNSGNTCDKVRDRTTCRNSYCNLVDMDNRKAAGGDSGGPWYSGSKAYGVHSGYHTALLKKRDQFTPVYNTLGDLGLSLNR